jgi:uncharacterized membrane protein
MNRPLPIPLLVGVPIGAGVAALAASRLIPAGVFESFGAFGALAVRHPMIACHLVTASAARLLGSLLLAGRKGNFSHRTLGWVWVLLMASTALSSVFLRDYRLPNIAGYTPIHLLTVSVALLLPLAVGFARRGKLRGHRRTMQGLYIGSCVLAGLFALLPGRFLGSLLWGAPITGISA